MKKYKWSLFECVFFIAYALCLTWLLLELTLIIPPEYRMVNYGAGEYYTLLVFLLAAFWIRFREIVRLTLILQTVVLLLAITLSAIGLIPNVALGINDRLRFSLGFDWVTFGPILYLFMCLAFLFLRREKVRMIEFGLMEIANIVFFLLTRTRFTFWILTLVLLFFAGLNLAGNKWMGKRDSEYKFNKSFWNFLVLFLPSLICIFAIGLHYFYDDAKPIWVQLNDFLTGRLSLGHRALNTYGFPIFGERIDWVGNSVRGYEGAYNFVDCSYLQILFNAGVIWLILVLAMYTYGLHWSVRHKDIYLQWILIFILLFSIWEPRLVSLTYNPFSWCTLSLLGQDIRERRGLKNGTKKSH